jgi:hypothetical protein
MSRTAMFLFVICALLGLARVVGAEGETNAPAAQATETTPAAAVDQPAIEPAAPEQVMSMEDLTRDITFEKVVEGLDGQKNTQLFVQQFWKNVFGKELVSSGEVVDVRPAKGQAEVQVCNKAKPCAERLNLRLIVPMQSQAAVLRRGQQINFKGYIESYRPCRGGGIILTLKNVELLP